MRRQTEFKYVILKKSCWTYVWDKWGNLNEGQAVDANEAPLLLLGAGWLCKKASLVFRDSC